MVMSCRTGVITLLLAAGVSVGAMRAPAGMGSGIGAMRALAGVGPRLSRPAIRRCPLTTITMTDEGEQTEEEPTNAGTDWDSAWQLEVAKRKTGTAGWRPEGRQPPTEAERARANVERVVGDAQSEVMGKLGEWNKSPVFWIGVIAVISVITAVAGQPQAAPYDPNEFAVV